ncbi:putative ribosomal protein L14P [Rosa chinensis]|uniref:Putative ribosomal protein L14P n=1 Tax=Rosa chinensis TaxID=74649 RepID=A0A2P6QRF4_ROSCH|nr:putative ribosomal protein L14P [Rosa chinensis]
MYFEDNAADIVNPKAEMKVAGSAITGPIGKECADLWPRIATAVNAIVSVIPSSDHLSAEDRSWCCPSFV